MGFCSEISATCKNATDVKLSVAFLWMKNTIYSILMLFHRSGF